MDEKIRALLHCFVQRGLSGNLAEGYYKLKAEATDNSGTVGSATITIKVGNPAATIENGTPGIFQKTVCYCSGILIFGSLDPAVKQARVYDTHGRLLNEAPIRSGRASIGPLNRGMYLIQIGKTRQTKLIVF